MNIDLINTLAVLPEQASNIAEQGDGLHYFIYGLSAFFFLLIIALMIWFAWKFRRKDMNQEAQSQASHSTALEIAWSLPPMIIVMAIFWFGTQNYIALAKPPADPMTIDVTAKQYAWTFRHPYMDYQGNELHIPINTPIEVVTRSDDVIHSLFIPAFRAKKDAVPGRYNYMYFTPTRTGVFTIYCTEYCGESHSSMVSRVHVYESQEAWQAALTELANQPFRDLPDRLFEGWKNETMPLAEVQAEIVRLAEGWKADADKMTRANLGITDPPAGFEARWEQLQSDAAVAEMKAELIAAADKWLAGRADKLKGATERGKEIYVKQGCSSCHSVDGSMATGPTWKGLWKNNRVFDDGASAIADENYIRTSILYPNRQVVANYAKGQMPQYAGKITDREIDALIAYIRSLE